MAADDENRETDSYRADPGKLGKTINQMAAAAAHPRQTLCQIRKEASVSAVGAMEGHLGLHLLLFT